jgi:acyl-CoA thioesterase
MDARTGTETVHSHDRELRDFLGLSVDSDTGRGVLVVANHLLNGRGGLWGGCGLSAAIAMGESGLGRGCVWATVQYVAPIAGGERLDLVLDVGQHGRALSQAAVRGMVGDRLALLATGTFGGGRGEPMQFVSPPDVPGPEDCAERRPPRALPRAGLLSELEQRAPGRAGPRPLRGQPGTGRTVLWMRFRRGLPMSPGALAILADLAPSAIAEAVGDQVFGVSLDNSIRVADASETEWVLLDVQVEAIIRGVAQINARMFDRAGRLLAIAGQSARIRPPDPTMLPLPPS